MRDIVVTTIKPMSIHTTRTVASKRNSGREVGKSDIEGLVREFQGLGIRYFSIIVGTRESAAAWLLSSRTAHANF